MNWEDYFTIARKLLANKTIIFKIYLLKDKANLYFYSFLMLSYNI